MLVLRSARLFVGNRFFQYLFVCFLIYQNLETEKKGRSGISKMVKVKVGKKCAKRAQNVPHLKMKKCAGLCSSVNICKNSDLQVYDQNTPAKSDSRIL